MNEAPFTERGLVFDCEGQQLVGVLADPALPARTGIVIVVGGPQVRAGAHRMFVQLARAWAATGIAVLRFDLRGMGDSTGEPAGVLGVEPDIAAAVKTLRDQVPGVQRLALCGLCDGATATALYAPAADGDAPLALCLINPWVHDPSTSARARMRQHYLRQLGQRQFWSRLFGGSLGWRSASGLLKELRDAALPGTRTGLQARVFDRLARHPGPMLVTLAGEDHTAAEFEHAARSRPAWRDLQASGRLQVRSFDGADHTFSRPGTMTALTAELQRWADELVTPPASR